MTAVTARRVFIAAPDTSTGVLGGAYYCRSDVDELVAIYSYTRRSDTVDVAYRKRSHDNGRSWRDEEEIPCVFRAADGTKRRHPRGGYLDPHSGRFVTIWTEGVLPTDNPLEGMERWTLHYAVSEDGGRTTVGGGQIVHEGEEYDAVHHLPGVTVGRNNVMLGDLSQRPLTRSDGVILVPTQSTPIGPDGAYVNPGGGYTYTDVLCLFGTWRSDGTLAWTASQRVSGDPNRTTRGLIEPTIAEIEGGRILMVMRGSNDVRPELPGYRWAAVSEDGGENWSRPEPWRYDDGALFYSPSSCSQLLQHSDGRLYWLGNISRGNPHGNRPRYPLVVGEVDRRSGALRRRSVTAIDDRRASESEELSLSNFYAREDRQTAEVVLYVPRAFSQGTRKPDGSYRPFPLLEYRIRAS